MPNGYYYAKALAGTRRAQFQGDQLVISATANDAPGGGDNIQYNKGGYFGITLPRVSKTGDAIGIGAVRASIGGGLAGGASWSAIKGSIVVESRTSRVVVLRFTKVVLKADLGGDFYKATGTLTFDGTLTAKIP